MIFSRRITFRDQRDQALYILGVVDDVTERRLAEARIARLAHYDPLTDVPNRTLFREQLMRELSFVRRGARLFVLCLDLDHFKSINDTLGHQAGDALLKEVAQRIRSCLNEGDLIARLGGDESQWCGQVCSIRKRRKRSRSNCGRSLPVTLTI